MPKSSGEPPGSEGFLCMIEVEAEPVEARIFEWE